MEQRYYRIYSELITHYEDTQAIRALPRLWRNFIYLLLGRRLAPPLYSSADIVSRIVDVAVGRILEGKTLRPDGRLFLISSLHQMVAMPLLHPRSAVSSDPRTSSLSEIEALILDDATEILRAASEFSQDRLEIPASHVLWGAAKVLDQLQLKSWRLWDR